MLKEKVEGREWSRGARRAEGERGGGKEGRDVEEVGRVR